MLFTLISIRAAMRNLPGDHSRATSSVEESLEWSVAHLMAHQWWGAAVGNDPAREAVLDEAMSSWSALLYFRETYGEEKAAAVLEDQLRGFIVCIGLRRRRHECESSFAGLSKHISICGDGDHQRRADVRPAGKLGGRGKLLAALRNYYKANLLEIADLDDLRGALVAEAPIEKRRAVARTFNRWLAGDW